MEMIFSVHLGGYCTAWCGEVDYVFRFGPMGIVWAGVYWNEENPVAPIHEERY